MPIRASRLWRAFPSLIDAPLNMEHVAVEIRPLDTDRLPDPHASYGNEENQCCDRFRHVRHK